MEEIYLISHTHWDREWYLPFQLFRRRLVGLIDRLLNIVEQDPHYIFHLDGQAVIIEDYLEVRPAQAPRLSRFLRNGQILIGPWYVLPDEFLVSGEALIRNLLLGRRLSESCAGSGSAMPVGYVPDSFGQTGQLPQILAGFGITEGVLWRGVGADLQQAEFWWEAPDGTRLLTVHIRGYCLGQALPEAPEDFARRIEQARAALAPRSASKQLLLMNGCDHQEAQPGIPARITALRERRPELDIRQARLPEYLRRVREMARPEWPVLRGELRRSDISHLLSGVLSARIWIKQRNAGLQTLLERWAEPAVALSGQLEPALAAAEPDFLQLAWKMLLQNHAHDSICGCSVDAVHREMLTRFDSVQQLTTAIAEDALSGLAHRVQTAAPDAVQALVVFNPTAAPRAEVLSATLALSADLPGFRLLDSRQQELPMQILSEDRREFPPLTLALDEIPRFLALARSGRIAGFGIQQVDFHLRQPEAAATGETCVVDITLDRSGDVNREALEAAHQQIQKFAAGGRIRNFIVHTHLDALYQLLFSVQGTPGWGYATAFVKPAADWPPALPIPQGTTIENERFSITADPRDGTLILNDKVTGRRWPGLHRIVDGGDNGDLYNYGRPPQDHLVAGPLVPPRIAVTAAGPVRWTLRIEMTYRLPAALAPDRRSRSEETVDIPITTEVHLGLGMSRVEFHTEIDNHAADHRLRIHFPTGLLTPVSQAGAAFDRVTRPVVVPPADPKAPERPTGTHPLQPYVLICDDEAGMLLATRGLPEYEIVAGTDPLDPPPMTPETPATLALTLLRAVGWLSRDDFEGRQGNPGPGIATPEAQLMGHHSFDYALVPFPGESGKLQAQLEAEAFESPLHAVAVAPAAGPLPAVERLVRLDPSDRLALSALKPPEAGSGLILRIWNRTADPVAGQVSFWRPIARAWRTNLAEESGTALTIDPHGELPLEVRGREIVTLRVELL